MKFLMKYSLLLLLFFTFSLNAFAYLDPGSGSMILQMIIGGIVGAALAIKTYWFKIKEIFKNLFKKK